MPAPAPHPDLPVPCIERRVLLSCPAMPQSAAPRSRNLYRFAWFLVGTVVLLIFFGGQVKSTGSGLSVPDWPNTFGHFMFSFPYQDWVGGVFWEHSHRLIASAAGLFTVIAAVWVWRVDRRPVVRRLAIAASAVVVIQGVFGGLTVLNALPVWASSTHGTLAQIYLSAVVVLALMLSPRWESALEGIATDPKLRKLSLIVCSLIFLQLVVGAIMRHSEAGLAVPDFPTMFGSWIPPLDPDRLAAANAELRMSNLLVIRDGKDISTIEMLIHLLHRAMAFLVAGGVGALWWRLNRTHAHHPPLARPAGLMLVLVVVQFSLGILTILTGRHFIITSLHVTVGALLLATSVALAVRVRSARVAPLSATVAAPRPSQRIETEAMA